MFTLGFADTPRPDAPTPAPKRRDKSRSDSAKPSPAPPPSNLPDGDDRPGIGEEINTTLLALLPWGISIIFHAGIVLLAIFVVWSTVAGIDEEEVIVPIARLSETPGAPLQQKTFEKVKTTSKSTRRTVTPTQSKSTLTSKINTQTALIGVAGGASKASPFGAQIASGAQFDTKFFGSGGNARRLAFLVDASGSLIDTFPFVIQELKRTIQQLNEKQQFTVIFFQGDRVIEVPPAGLKQATAENKQAVAEWIDPTDHNVTPFGKSNPVPALQRALKYKPQLIYLLSDNITGAGKFEIDQRRLIAEIEAANTSATKINTIQFLYPDPLSKLGLPGTLELVSKRTGGVYKFVDARELNIE